MKYRIDVANSNDPKDNYSLLYQTHPREGDDQFYKIFWAHPEGFQSAAIDEAEWREHAAQVGELVAVAENSDFGSGALIDHREKAHA